MSELLDKAVHINWHQHHNQVFYKDIVKSFSPSPTFLCIKSTHALSIFVTPACVLEIIPVYRSGTHTLTKRLVLSSAKILISKVK